MSVINKINKFLNEKKLYYIETWDDEFTVYPSKKSKKTLKHFKTEKDMMKWAEKEGIDLERRS